MKRKERLNTAYHEAGHAVIAYRYGHYTDRITIAPGKRSGILGSAKTEDVSADETSYREQIIVLFAGFSAEQVYDRKADPNTSKDDEERALQLLRIFSPGTNKILRDESVRLVKKNWTAIQSVATALIENKTLSGDEWMIIVDSIDEDRDWRVEFEKLRFIMKQFGRKGK